MRGPILTLMGGRKGTGTELTSVGSPPLGAIVVVGLRWAWKPGEVAKAFVTTWVNITMRAITDLQVPGWTQFLEVAFS